MVDKDLLEQISEFFHASRSERENILAQNLTKTLNKLAARNMLSSSSASDEISKLYAGELVTKVNIAWENIKKLFEKRNISLSRDDTDGVREKINKLINLEFERLYKDVQGEFNTKFNSMRSIDFDKKILTSLGGARNQALSKIRAELNFYMKSKNSSDKAMDKVLLEPVQKELLITIVEACRNTPLNKRVKFLLTESSGGDTLVHPFIPADKIKVYSGDIKILARAGLLALGFGSNGSLNFDVTPLGFKYYEYLKKRMGEPIERIEAIAKKYLDAHSFQQKYPESYKQWAAAEQILWSLDDPKEGTSIGHLCREAVQEFAEVLIKRFQLPNAPNKTKTVERLKTIVKMRHENLGKTEKPFLEALVAYWGTLIDLIQRQEHGGHKEGEPLIWEDARRVIFQTIIVMFEIDRALS